MKIHRCCLPAMRCLGLSFVLAFSSCYEPYRAFYMSPADIRATPYVTVPMHADPEKTVTAANLSFGLGNSNEDSRDKLIGGSATVMQSHHFGFFQGYYGAALGMGDYNNGSVNLGGNYDPSTSTDTGTYHIPGIKKFYGYYGLNGGVNVVVPFANGKGEWRALGLDVAYRKEFGDYLGFRRSQPVDKINILASYGHIFTVGGSTEIVGRNSRDVQFGYKIAAGGIIRSPGSYTGASSFQKPFYINQTFQVTKSRVTGFIQLMIGTYANSFQTGVNINLRRRTNNFPVPERKPRRVRERTDNGRPKPLRPFERRPVDTGEHD